MYSPLAGRPSRPSVSCQPCPPRRPSLPLLVRAEQLSDRTLDGGSTSRISLEFSSAPEFLHRVAEPSCVRQGIRQVHVRGNIRWLVLHDGSERVACLSVTIETHERKAHVEARCVA